MLYLSKEKVNEIKVGDKVLLTSDLELINKNFLPKYFASKIIIIYSVNTYDNEYIFIDKKTSGYWYVKEYQILENSNDIINSKLFKATIDDK